MRNLHRLSLEHTPEELARDDMINLSFGHTPNKLDLFPEAGEQGLATEEVADGKVFKEIEHTIYARIVNPVELEKAASKEHQEQWEIRVAKTDKNAGDGSIRVRKTVIPGGDPVFVRTSKIRQNADGDKLELPMPSNEDEFNMVRFLAEQGLIKDRYFFPIEGTKMVWEVDMFPKIGGGYHEWVKIDLEVEDREAAIPPFPIELTDVIMPKGFGRQDEEQSEALVRKIYDDCFIAKNQFLHPPADGETAMQNPPTQNGNEVPEVGPGNEAPAGAATDTPPNEQQGQQGGEGDVPSERKVPENPDAEKEQEAGVQQTPAESTEPPAAGGDNNTPESEAGAGGESDTEQKPNEEEETQQ